MKRLMKWLLRVLAGLVSACAAIVLVFAALINTQWGLHWSYGILSVIVPGTLTITDMQGRLSGPLMLSGVEYQNDDFTLKIQHFQLDWIAAALFDGTLHIEHLQVIGMDVQSTATTVEEAPRPIELPDITLPVNIIVDHATLMEFTATSPAQAEPLRLDALILSAYTRNDTLNVNNLHIATTSYTADMNGFITPAGVYPFELRIDWSLPQSPLGRVAGHGRMHGNVRRIAFEHELAEPSRVAARGIITEPLTELAWKGDLIIPATSLQGLRADWPALQVAVTAKASGDLHSAAVQGTSHTVLPTLTLAQRFDAHFERNTLTLRELIISTPQQPGQLRVKGDVRFEAEPVMQLKADWQQLRWPLEGLAQVQSDSGHARIEGTPQSYDITSTARVSGPHIPTGEWALSGHGNERELDVVSLEGTVLDGKLRAQASIQWLPQLQWVAQVSGERLNPGTQWPDWPGRLHLSAQSAGSIDESGLHLSADINTLHGQFKGYPLDAGLRLIMNQHQVELQDLHIALGDNQLHGTGVMNDQWLMDWEFNAKQLAQLIPELGGAARGSGQLRGNRDAPIVIMSAAGEGLTYQEQRIEELTLSAAVDVTDATPSTVIIEASGLQLNDQRVTGLTLRGDGTTAQHSLHATLNLEPAALDLNITGKYHQDQWRGEIETLDLRTRDVGQWRLAAPTLAAVAKDTLHLGPLCLQEQRAELCVQGGWTVIGGWAAHAQAERIPLRWVAPLLPENTTLEGEIMAVLSAAQAPGSLLTAHLTAQASPGALSFAPDQQEPVEVAYTDAQLVARANPHAVLADLEMPLRNGGTLIANLSVPRRELPGLLHSELAPQTALQGHARVVLPDLSLLPAFLPGVENTRGSLSGALRLKGSVRDPKVTGQINLSEGSLSLPGLGINIDTISAEVVSDEQGRLQLQAQGRSGNLVTLQGSAFLESGKGWQADVSMRGENVEVVHTPEYHALVSPDMRIKVRGTRIDLAGDLVIPEANIRPRDLGGAAHASDDVIVSSEEALSSTATRWQVHSQVRVRLGDFVRFNGFGLRARLGGEVMLLDAPLQPTTARGELRVDEGEYRAYGQKLTVERGRLLFFGGPVDNPGLDVRAVRYIPEHNVAAGVMVRGPIKAPQITIFSDPAMAETDALSFMLIGRPMNQASSAEGQQLYGAATSLGLAGGSMLATQIGRRFGIEDVRVESGGGFGEGALVIRHYLSPSLYISYGIGLFEHFNVFLMRYQISRLWALEAETGVNSGADIIYTLERD